MENIYEMFETDDQLEASGVWIDYGKAGSFLVGRMGGANTKFAQVFEAKMRPYRRQLDNKTLPLDVAEKVLRESFIEACLMGWENVKDRKGKAIKFSKAAADKLFQDLPDLFTDLHTQASQMANFKVEEVEEDAGN